MTEPKTYVNLDKKYCKDCRYHLIEGGHRSRCEHPKLIEHILHKDHVTGDYVEIRFGYPTGLRRESNWDVYKQEEVASLCGPSGLLFEAGINPNQVIEDRKREGFWGRLRRKIGLSKD